MGVLRREHSGTLVRRRRHAGTTVRGVPRLTSVRVGLSEVNCGVSALLFHSRGPHRGITQLGRRSLTLRTRGHGLLQRGKFNRSTLSVGCAYPTYGSSNFIGSEVYGYRHRLLGRVRHSGLHHFTPVSSYAFSGFGVRCCPTTTVRGNISPHRGTRGVLRSYHECTRNFVPRSTDVLFVNNAKLNGARLDLTVTGIIVGEKCSIICNATRGVLSSLRGRDFNESRDLSCARRSILTTSLLVVSSLNARFGGRFSITYLCGVVGAHVLGGGPAVVDAGFDCSSLRHSCGREVADHVTNICSALVLRKGSVECVGWFGLVFVFSPQQLYYPLSKRVCGRVATTFTANTGFILFHQRGSSLVK